MAVRRKSTRSMSPSRSTHASDPFIDTAIQFDDETAYKSLILAVFPNISIVSFEVCKEGITNKLIKCKCVDRVLLIRIYGRKSELLIDRLAELSTLKLLAEFELAEPVYGKFRNGLIYGYVAGAALKTEQIPEVSPKIAQRMAQWHSQLPVITDPVLFQTLRKWYNGLPDHFSNVAMQSMYDIFDQEYLLAAIDYLEMTLPDSKTVFCHNDLLAANIIYQEDVGRVQFIDFEYASTNPRAFDIANHFCEWAGFECEWGGMPTRDQRRAFYEAYLGADAGCTWEELDREVMAYEPVPSLLWCLWAILQAQYSEIDFDYLGYGRKRYERLRELLII